VRRVADQEFDVELKVRNLLEIALEHRAVTGEAEGPAVVSRVVGDESRQIWPILPVQAGDVAAVEVGESGFGHGATLETLPWLLSRTYPTSGNVYLHFVIGASRSAGIR
jgi:hypothetical protein